MAGSDANWRRTLGEPCTVSFGCGRVDLLPGRENTIESDVPFFMLVNAETDAGIVTADIHRVLAALKTDGLIDRTIVLTMDIGEQGGSVVVGWSGRSMNDSSRDEPVTVLDIAPTVLSLAAVPVPSYMTGRVLIGADDEPPTPTDDVPSRSTGAPLLAPWMEGVPPVAATPRGRPIGGLFHVAPVVTLRCDTEGSTIIYTTELVAPFYWWLYTGPFRMRFWTLRVRCGRLGYRDSDVVRYDFNIE